jgi:hypothetical protein
MSEDRGTRRRNDSLAYSFLFVGLEVHKPVVVDFYLMGHNAVQSVGNQGTYLRNLSPPS